ncbi:MAG TPA: DUF4390 domain-containing protein [Dissulfurispiraceae bacterium]|nr:DUF4390 domain-containing protein [Dissulfurispiraceae bacterium]
MRKLIMFFTAFLLFPQASSATEIMPVDVRVGGGVLYVTTTVAPGAKFVEDLSEGLSKEVTIFVDLFRVWKIWPDEFIQGRKLTKILKSDPIRREYVASSTEGEVQREKRFKDVESMLAWAMRISDLRLAVLSKLEPGEYFVKVTVEAQLRKLPPVVGQLLFFIPQKEFNVNKTSVPFQVPLRQDR